MKLHPWILAAALAILPGLAEVRAQETYDFMPRGGKALLIELLGSPVDTAELRLFTGTRRNEDEWNEFLATRKEPMSDNERRTLAAYLAVNMPLMEGALDEAAGAGDMVAALPPDGRELAWNYCQFCHSLFTSHLMQDRDVRGWLGMFESPFHREIGMSQRERETFARYSAINMPLRIEEVPEDLRF
ncbi:MAG: hypothetical protein OEZ03_13205 [Alphaproteobacteria bacterium]|nr:hypothetical protein [Alphaproteobacteria bacterium]